MQKEFKELNAAHEKVKKFKCTKSKHTHAKGNERKEEKESRKNRSLRRF